LEKVMGGPAKTKPAEPRPLPAHSVLPLLTETFSTSASGTGAEPPTEMRVYKWIYSDGRWIRVAQEAPVATQPSGEGAGPVRPAGERPIEKKSFEQMEAEADPFGWKKADKSRLTRIIAINLKKLNNGDPRMNIVIRDKDVIRIPTLEVGEFYVMGEVLRPGVYSLTGRRVTVKQALTAAGNLGALAWPQNSILVRRIGDDQEQTVPIDIEAIFRGEEPDFLLKPNDVLAIGTDIRATFFAVLRNAFRMTYGFGFIYDRNFADPYVPTLNSKRFTRW
ncbi:MAG: hypothetical protein KAU28_04520, partial [Phycisphaerae bacterium]|nr:hypothetical protein [Phycisphaerae bacterium]